ncbi:hypothetical protein [Flavilitoribacter nigricans]|uniref:Uncharacterized protein n=1 Tax=Flavilitoribacter nigricans (strain ATCC 23147 / DSM 23189 / NBRC 102662 / NCIMB 1420 / SS-2) TaxID=1122177 RepID=A0A2D0MZ34_FLAN2|nr:hypothetical protein [Flavilitoribacter nigricans]PHN01149.1 hypothetical protein CRP01_38750 [Flavilitoribacter nigricans DSM 23189 = NBRC 102662]
MNKLDEYHLWLMHAVSSPLEDTKKHYYYDCQKKILFGVYVEGNTLKPLLRHKYISIKDDDIAFGLQIDRLKHSRSELIEVPKLSLEDRIFFYNNFFESLDKEDRRIFNKHHLQILMDRDFDNEIKKENRTLFARWDRARDVFLASKIKIIERDLQFDFSTVQLLW